MKELRFKIDSLGGTRRLAGRLAKNVKGGEIIGLIGELGVGKTYFVKFFAEALGISSEEIISPTFVIWRKHVGRELILNHFDLYRVAIEESYQDIGLDEAINDKQAVTLIEWADRLKGRMPKDILIVKIIYLGESQREMFIRSTGEKSDHLLEGLTRKG